MVECHGSQCGFCTPGFVMSLFALYHEDRAPSRQRIHDALAGNLCRCTGYRPIVEAARRMYELGEGDQFSAREPRDDRAAARRFDGATGWLRRTAAGATSRRAGRRAGGAVRAFPSACLLAGGTDVGCG